MSGPDKIPQGSWGGDLDPMAQQNRMRFEAQLEAQQKQLQQLHLQAAQQQAPTPRGVQVIDKMPDEKRQGPDASEYTIPSAGSEGDLIGQMGAEHTRSEHAMAKAREATGEGPPVPENPVPPPPPKGPRPVGHIPKSLRAQMAQQPVAATAIDPISMNAGKMAFDDFPNEGPREPFSLKRNPAKKAIRRLMDYQAETAELFRRGAVDVDMALDLLERTIELQFRITKYLQSE